MNQDKINNRIMEMFENREFDNDFINIELDNFISNKLLSYQHLHVYNLISCFKNNDIIIDGSETGTGKTFTSLAVCKYFDFTPLIICPRGTIAIWKRVCNNFNIVPIDIINYEMIRPTNLKNKNYLEINNNKYLWKFNNNNKTVIIFDEAHKCRNNKTLNGKLLLSLKNICKILLLSATLCDNPKNFAIFGYMLNFYNSMNKGKKWIGNIIREQNSNKHNYNILHKYIFPSKGSRMNMSEIKYNFPMNKISVESFDIEKKYLNVINDKYENIKNINRSCGEDKLVKINSERQTIEIIKIPIIVDLIKKYLYHNKSVAVFINFRHTQNQIIKYLSENNIEVSYINGSQDVNEREENINKFQNNITKVIISTIQSGGQSINLHDITGNNPRVSIINPSFSSTDLLQTLGRIYRAGLKSPALQIILFCANTIEDQIYKKIREKINFMDTLTDDDLSSNIFK